MTANIKLVGRKLGGEGGVEGGGGWGCCEYKRKTETRIIFEKMDTLISRRFNILYPNIFSFLSIFFQNQPERDSAVVHNQHQCYNVCSASVRDQNSPLDQLHGHGNIHGPNWHCGKCQTHTDIRKLCRSFLTGRWSIWHWLCINPTCGISSWQSWHFNGALVKYGSILGRDCLTVNGVS